MSNPNSELIDNLKLRLETYVNQCKRAEEENNNGKIRRYKRIIAQYEKCIKDAVAGRDPSLQDLPNPPGFASLIVASVDAPQSSDVSPVPEETVETNELDNTPDQPVNQPAFVIDEVAEPADLSEKLTIRLQKYSSILETAEAAGEAGAKIRRYKRICTQYRDSIKKVNDGKQIDLTELPNPPGFPPLVPPSSPLPTPQPSPVLPRVNPTPTSGPSSTTASVEPVPARQPHHLLSRAEKQTMLLRDRQKEYRDAALNAKRVGQIEEAKEFLKICKGFDRLINASESGLPVDLTTIPVSLSAAEQAQEEFVVVTNKDFEENSDSELYEMVKNELQAQIESCKAMVNQLKGAGDIANANKFAQFALAFKKDYNKIVMFQGSGQAVPKFRYEQKTFPIVDCFSDVGMGNVELSIVQAVGLPKAVDSYVAYEFPYPSESPPYGYTSVVKNSDSPVFNFVYNFPIDRDNKQCQRMFKRQGQSGIKLELWARGGFLRKDVSLGTVIVKLLPLTTEIMIHDAFDLMNGRRPAGGKLEVKVRIREPILTKKIRTVTEKWLVLE